MKDFKPGKGGMQQLAVDKLKIADDVLKMFKDGVPIKTMCAVLEAEKGIKIGVASVGKWLRKQKKAIKAKTTTELASKEKFEVMVMDYQTEISNILEEVKEMKDIAKNDRKLDTYAKLVDRLYKGIELIAKLSGDIKGSGSVDINVIINEINKDSFDNHKETRGELFDKSAFDIKAEIIGDNE